MLPSHHSIDEEVAASAVVSLKRSLDKCNTIIDLSDERARKMLKRSDPPHCPTPSSDDTQSVGSEATDATCESAASFSRVLRPAPFFYYRDHSQEKDSDSLAPLTLPGRIPNFPAKMHTILSRDDFKDVVAWQSHGRSWRLLDTKAFEVRVLPQFFQHRKLSSFIRQANGWGFRRITQGPDRNTYYHELFLRGMPFLCKGMKRPGIAKKVTGDPEHEPDLSHISELHPVPEAKADETVLLPCALVTRPKALAPAVPEAYPVQAMAPSPSVHLGVVTPPKAASPQPQQACSPSLAAIPQAATTALPVNPLLAAAVHAAAIRQRAAEAAAASAVQQAVTLRQVAALIALQQQQQQQQQRQQALVPQVNTASFAAGFAAAQALSRGANPFMAGFPKLR